MRQAVKTVILVIVTTSWFAVTTGPASAEPGRYVGVNLTIGPGGTGSFLWQINDAGPSTSFPSATGVAGPTPNASNQVSGWSLILVPRGLLNETFLTGDLNWSTTSAPGLQFQLALQTLVGPYTTVGADNPGPMSDFDPRINYAWPFIKWGGTFNPPGLTSAQLTADTLFDTSGIANPILGTFGLQFDPVNSKQIDIVYFTSVPEPGTLGLVALGALGVWRAVLRRSRR